MQWPFTVALVPIVPVILLLAISVAHLNLHGLTTLLSGSRRRRPVEEALARSRQ